MKTKLMVLMLLAGGSMFAATRFSFGVNLGNNGGYYTQAIPPCPGPGYTWANGYWNPPAYGYGYAVGPRYERHDFDRDDHDRDRGRDYRQSNFRDRGERR